MREKRAQIWVETVVYTLIGISIIGILLAVAKPKIEEMRDRVVIEQTIDSLNKIHAKIIETSETPGNQRKVGLKMSKGRLTIDGNSDEIRWDLESNYKYSQIDSLVELGAIKVLTTNSNPFKVSIFLNYSFYNLTFQGSEKMLELEESPTPYNLFFSNRGLTSSSKINIDVDVRG